MELGRRSLLAAGGAAFIVLSVAGNLLQAQATIAGRVISSDTKLPITAARVLIVGGTGSATTNDDGRYTLRQVAAGAQQLQVLRVGYGAKKQTVTVAAGETATADFQLETAVVQLQEIVTTATGQQRRVELGNAVSTFGDVGKRVEEGAVTSLADVLVAKAPGVIVLPGVMTGGAPTIRIRGLSSISLTNAPIYVVDGIR